MELPGGLGIFKAEQSISDTRSENSRLIPPPVEEVDIFHQASRRGEHDGVIVWIFLHEGMLFPYITSVY